jgi:predicted nucleotidyltransferase
MVKQNVQNIIISHLKGFNPLRIALFGSFIRKDNLSPNDIDILVQFQETLSLLQLITIENELSEKLGIKVDLITEGSLENERLKKSIKKNMQIIYQA